MKNIIALTMFMSFISCSSAEKIKFNLPKIDINKFMGDWYVLAGRFTFLEKDVHNGLEKYTWNEEKKRIDVSFTYRKGSFDGPIKSVPQKGWIYNLDNNAHWKVSPFWPLKFDYLVIDIDENYSWTAIGVPSQKYLWIMSRNWKNPSDLVPQIIERIKAKGYNADNIVNVPHDWP